MADAYAAVYEEETKDLSEYLAGLARRKWQILLVTALLAIATAAIAYLLPPVYRSTATVLVQEQEIPPDLVRSTITSFADERIQVITQQVMTRGTLLALVEKYDLYGTQRRFETNDELLARMRKDIKVTPVNANMTDRRGGRVNATIAFTVSFDSDRPEKAQRVVNELVSLYLSENVKTRQLRVAETSTFLSEEAERIRQQVDSLEAKLAAFKRANQGKLPLESQANLQLLNRADQELMQIERSLSDLEDRRIYLQSQLAAVPASAPVVVGPAGSAAVDPATRLQALRNQYASMSAVYSADHPDVRRLKLEIDGLAKEVGNAPGAGGTEELDAQKAQLAQLREKYSEEHPDVGKLKRSIAALEAANKSAGGSRSASGPVTRAAPNPLYVTLQSQLASTDSEIRSLRALREEMRGRLRSYEQQLERSPDLEREYRELTRERDAALDRYRELKAKLMTAEVAQELEKDRKAERFTLIEPPERPEKPFSPNRPAIFMIGLALSVGGGLGLGFLLEALDKSIKGTRDLARRVAVPVLAAVPYILSEREQARRFRTRMAIVGAVILALLIALVFVHVFVMPLQVLGYVVLRRLGIDWWAPRTIPSPTCRTTRTPGRSTA